MTVAPGDWPELPYEAWRPTRDTLHMYLQVIGKVRLALAPMEPQWGQVPLYVTARGLNTSPLPHAAGVFDIDVDLIDHAVSVRVAHGGIERIPLEPRSVADFYRELMGALEEAGRPRRDHSEPQEVPEPIPFTEDTVHASYEPEWANRFWRALVSADAVMKEHRARFLGKTSPFPFLGRARPLLRPIFGPAARAASRRRPDHPLLGRRRADLRGVLARRRAATRSPDPSPMPSRTPGGSIRPRSPPETRVWSPELGEFLLPYEAVRTAPDPHRALLDFLETTYRPRRPRRMGPALVAPAGAVASGSAS